ncbi:MAG: hypothetical protein LBC61_00570 [Candidatus Peribacteria bacterium]|nr:hypothetical protein [Candidatus Peribacteria bacterium]
MALSICNIDISAHLTKFHHQTTIQTSTLSSIKVFITSQILSTTSKSNQNPFSPAKASPEIFKSILINYVGKKLNIKKLRLAYFNKSLNNLSVGVMVGNSQFFSLSSLFFVEIFSLSTQVPVSKNKTQ